MAIARSIQTSPIRPIRGTQTSRVCGTWPIARRTQPLESPLSLAPMARTTPTQVVRQQQGQIGKALSYNGSTDGSFAAINLSATNIATLSFWMKWTTNANDDDLAFEYTPNYNSNAGGFIADWNSSSYGGGKFETGMGKGNGTYWTDLFTRPSAGAWHLVHLVFNRSGPTNKVYVDGSLPNANNRLHTPLRAWAIFPIARSISCPGQRARSMPPGRLTKSGCRQSNAMPAGLLPSTTTKARPEHLSPWAARAVVNTSGRDKVLTAQISYSRVMVRKTPPLPDPSALPVMLIDAVSPGKF